MIIKTEAVALRVSPFSRTSHVVSWFTAGYGRITTIIKGAQRPRSAFLGQYDLFYTCELLFYSRERNGAHIARECCPINTRKSFRRNWKACAAASYVCDLVSQSTAHNEHHIELYDLISTSLDSLCEHVEPAQIVTWFELKFAGLMGFAPRLTSCSACGKAIAGRTASRFSSVRGGMLCGGCASFSQDGLLPLSPDVIAILRNWQKSGTINIACTIRCTGNQLSTLLDITGNFLNYHMDIGMIRASRKVMLDVLSK